jgi:DNA-binding NarL/FixJ family response regulator
MQGITMIRSEAMQARARPRTVADALTTREVEVLERIAAGYTTREIAASLVISAGTVERHITNLYAKIGARGRADATAYAFRHGLAGRTGAA